MWLFSVLLLLLTGTMFVTSPAALIARLTPMENDAQLWVATAYLLKQGQTWFSSLVTALPATFMSVISLTYILMASEGYGLVLNRRLSRRRRLRRLLRRVPLYQGEEGRDFAINRLHFGIKKAAAALPVPFPATQQEKGGSPWENISESYLACSWPPR